MKRLLSRAAVLVACSLLASCPSGGGSRFVNEDGTIRVEQVSADASRYAGHFRTAAVAYSESKPDRARMFETIASALDVLAASSGDETRTDALLSLSTLISRVAIEELDGEDIAIVLLVQILVDEIIVATTSSDGP